MIKSSTGILLPFVVFGVLSKVASAHHYGECRTALGMEAGQIPDSAISASSSYEAKSVGPQNARIRQEKNGGAWCPKAQISSEIREFLEVDLSRDHLITWTETQGRFGNGQGQEYAESFLIEYWRNSLNRWVPYRDAKERQILKGNTNTYLVVRQELELPFVANRVRFIPYSEHPRTVCMRVEIYGCSWENHVVRYDAPVGKGEKKLQDLSYDGMVSEGYMKGGLGQLVDGLYGEDVFDPADPSDAGSRWVGWLNETGSGGRPLDITFEFDSPREFTFAHVYVNNMFTRSVQVFSAASVYFSLDGIRYQPTPVRMTASPDLTRESGRNVSIPLENRVGKFVKIQFDFTADWILISEISFESGSIQGNATEEILEQYFFLQDGVVESGSPGPDGETTNARKELTPAKSPTNNTQAYVGLITGILAVIVLLLACTILLVVRRGRKKVALLHKHTALVSSSTKPGVTINMKDLKMNVALSTPIINNTLTRSRLTSKSRCNGKIGGTNDKDKRDAYGNGLTAEESDSENSSVYHEPYKLLPSTQQEYGCLIKRDALSSSKSGEYTDFTSVNSFQDEVKFSPSFYSLATASLMRPPPYEMANYQTPTKNFQQTTVFPENYYAATDIVRTERREQHFTLGKLTPIKIPEGSAPEDFSNVPEFPRHRLRVLEKLGEGGFGMVHLCEADGLSETNGISTSHKKQLVLIKSLWRGATDSTKKDFLRESSWLANLKDGNLSRVVGVCTLEDSLYVLQEYSDLGDLPQFLKMQSSTEDEDSAISYGCLLYMATQIASGMKYLESHDLVHRDLAARNCLLGKNYSVKVSDHAIYCNKYSNDYYLVDTKARLPVRWMAWESLLLGKQTSKSDVWSFAVTLWEILTYCNQQPFAELTNEQVVENSNRLYQNDGTARYPQKPGSCPREIYDLMGECWKRQAADRPMFSEIHLFLQRKNLGYVPVTG